MPARTRDGKVTPGRDARTRRESLLKELSEAAGKTYVSPLSPAEIHLGLGDHPSAITLVEQAVEHCSPRVVWLGVDPLYAPLKGSAAFTELCRSIGVVGH